MADYLDFGRVDTQTILNSADINTNQSHAVNPILNNFLIDAKETRS